MTGTWREAAPRCSAGVSLHLLEGESLLFDEPAQALIRLNGAATALWCLLAEGGTPHALAQFLAAAHQMPDAAAAATVARTLSVWRGRGLIDRAGEPSTARAGRRITPSPMPARADGAFRLHRRCGALCLTLGWDEAALTAQITAAVAHLPPASPQAASACLEVVAAEGGYLVLADAEPVGQVATADTVACWLRAGLIRLLARHVPHVLALHAAALGRDGACLLLPAPSGAGKTTLAAALCAAGWRYLGDDVTLLEAGTHAALPVPTPLAVKPGSVPLLAPFYPELAALPEMRSGDGRAVRHLSPPAARVSHVPMTVRWIVLPGRNGRAGLPSPLSPRDALMAVLETCEATPRPLTAADVAALVDWIGSIACFRLPLRPLPLAIARIGTLIGNAAGSAGAGHEARRGPARGGGRSGPVARSPSPGPAACRRVGAVNRPRRNPQGGIGHGA